MPTKNKPSQQLSLDQLITEKVSRKNLADVELIKIESYEIVEPGISIKVNKKTIEIHINIKIPTRKLFKWLGGLTALTGGAFTLLKWLLPLLTSHFPNPPP